MVTNSVINKIVIEDPFQCKLVEQKSSSTLSVFSYRNKEKETILQKVSLHSFHTNQVMHRDHLGGRTKIGGGHIQICGAQAEEAFLYQRTTQSSQGVVQLSRHILKIALIMKHLFFVA